MSDQAEAAQPETKPETETETEGASEPSPDELTPDEKKFLMLTLWDALITPKWTKDTLIDFGKAIFSKKPLKDMSDKEFNLIFPFLRDATLNLGKKLAAEARRQKEPESEKKEDEKTSDTEEKK